jgi:hypothetical protein
MNTQLKLEEISEEGRRQLALLDGGEKSIGRDVSSAEGVNVGNQAVSGRHGLFLSVRGHWLYKDLGSTNGSWLNGQKLQAGKWYSIRSGARLQLANTVIEIAVIERPTSNLTRLLVVFDEGEFFQDLPVPEYGKALVVGGSNADLGLRGDLSESPSLVVERRGSKICAYSVSKTIPVLHNREEISEVSELLDGDELSISSYDIIFLDPRQSSFGEPSDIAAMGQGHYASPFREWDSSGASKQGEAGGGPVKPSAGQAMYGSSEELEIFEKPQRQVSRSLFGKTAEDDEEEVELAETVSMSYSEFEERLKGGDVHPSMRHVRSGRPPSRPIEDRIYFVFFVALLLVLLLIFIVWLV